MAGRPESGLREKCHGIRSCCWIALFMLGVRHVILRDPSVKHAGLSRDVQNTDACKKCRLIQDSCVSGSTFSCAVRDNVP